MTYDVVIVGAGPAGVSAGVYSARKKMRTLVLTGSIGGSSSVSGTIENWIGDISISGKGFSERLESHLRSFDSVEVREGETVLGISGPDGGPFDVKTERGETFRSKAVIIASGVRHRPLGIPGEETFRGKGVAYCATCDAPIFRNRAVAVVGGGNSAFEAAEDLLPYASKVTILTIDPEFTADPVLRDRVLSSEKTVAIRLAKSQEVVGERRVAALLYSDVATGTGHELPCEGVFVEIGMMPNSEIAEGVAERNAHGEVVVDPRTFSTSRRGIFAAGDVTDMPYRQNNISAGQGAVAALSSYDFLKRSEESV